MNELKAKRAAALVEKKRRLEELKARRNNRSTNTAQSSAVSASKTGNLDEYIDSLLHSAPPGGSITSKANVAKGNAADSVSTGTRTEAKVSFAPAPAMSKIDQMNQDQTMMATSASTQSSREAPLSPVKKVETFAMCTQTEEDEFPMQLAESDDNELQVKKSETGDQSMNEDISSNSAEGNEDMEKEPKLLTEDEISKTYSSAPFSTFFNSASKKVERLLGAPLLSDLLLDDTQYYTDKESKRDASTSTTDRKDSFVTAQIPFSFPKWTANRDITSLDWSPHRGELMLASYHMPSSSSSSTGSTAVPSLAPNGTPSASLLPRSKTEMTGSDGLVIVWNLAMPSRPEHIFTCGSPLLNAKFHPTEGSLVVGACYSGQVVVWDTRSKGRLPVQRSSLNILGDGKRSGGHVHPIVGMETIDSGFVTAASDGTVNFWSFSNLMEPAETVIVPGANISSLAIAPESGTILVGEENGSIHAIFPSTSGGGRSSSSKRTIVKFDSSSKSGGDQPGHYGNVTGLSTKPPLKNNSNVGIVKGFARGHQGLVLSSGVDWTTKLWAPAYTEKPLLSLLSHSYDYMSDVAWSPVHPSIFATASSNGTIGLWNLAASLDEPMNGSQGLSLENGNSSHGVNKIKWSPDGRRIVAACSDTLHVLGMSDELWKTKGNEGTRIINNLKGRGLLEDDEDV